MNATASSPRSTRRATRASLACLPCRSRHLKCDGGRPRCGRCAGLDVVAGIGGEEEEECRYTQSRRGGLDRAALAERRKRLAAAEGLGGAAVGSGESVSPPVLALGVSASVPGGRSLQQSSRESSSSNSFLDGGLLSGVALPSPEPSPPQLQVDNIETDPLICSYYRTFHRFHPFILPHKHLATLHRQDPTLQARLLPLLSILRLIGRLYTTQDLSLPLRDTVEATLSSSHASPTDPFLVQSRLLYSIVLFWHSFKAEAKCQMDAAVKMAMEGRMYRREFAVSHAGGDVVLAESWRRAWWMLYVTDAYYAGTLGTMNFAVVDVEATMELPCEEAEYESGNIPPDPKTLEDFDSREFAADDIPFSSFAYLIGAVRCAASAIVSTPKVPIQETSTQVIQAADSALGAWLLLLPRGAKQVLGRNGEVDELMFQAHLLIHVAIIGLHRPLSDLKFNAVEDISSCAREPPLETPTPSLINVHTVRVLRSVEAQIRLLNLASASQSSSPSSSSSSHRHTPFTTCMVSEGTLALLSACKFLFKGRELQVARDQIRMTIGVLRGLGELWPRAGRNVQELRTIARHVLGLGSGSTSGSTTRSEGGGGGDAGSATSVATLGSAGLPPSLSGGEDESSLESSEVGVSPGDLLEGDGGLDTMCGWYSWMDTAPDISMWIGAEP